MSSQYRRPSVEQSSQKAQAPQEKPAQQDLGKAPIWRFVLPFLVVFLALGQDNDSWANDSSLYPEEIDENAAFVRVVNFDTGKVAEAMENGLLISIENKFINVPPQSASPFYVINSGESMLKLATQQIKVTAKPQEYITLAVDQDPDDKRKIRILGRLSYQHQPDTPRNKAGIYLYNFSSLKHWSLTTRGGKVTIFDNIPSTEVVSRTVNPISLRMGVNYRDQIIAQSHDIRLTPRGNYSVFVTKTPTSPLVVFDQDNIAR